MPTEQVPLWHFRSMHAAQAHQRRRAQAEPLRAEQRADHDVAAGLDLPVDLEADAVAQAFRPGPAALGQAQFPRSAGVLDGGQGVAPVPPSWPLMRISSASALATPAATVPTPTCATSLTLTLAPGLAHFEVVDQLGEVLDGVDVVVRRRGDERHARRGVAQAGDFVGDLVAGELAALAGLGALGDLDLQLVGVGEIVDGDAESAATRPA